MCGCCSAQTMHQRSNTWPYRIFAEPARRTQPKVNTRSRDMVWGSFQSENNFQIHLENTNSKVSNLAAGLL